MTRLFEIIVIQCIWMFSKTFNPNIYYGKPFSLGFLLSKMLDGEMVTHNALNVAFRGSSPFPATKCRNSVIGSATVL